MGSAHSSIRAHLGKNSWKRKIWWWTNIYITSTADVFLTTVKKYPGVYSCFVSKHRMELHAPVVLLLDKLLPFHSATELKEAASFPRSCHGVYWYLRIYWTVDSG
jgi:hypothetical protein